MMIALSKIAVLAVATAASLVDASCIAQKDGKDIDLGELLGRDEGYSFYREGDKYGYYTNVCRSITTIKDLPSACSAAPDGPNCGACQKIKPDDPSNTEVYYLGTWSTGKAYYVPNDDVDKYRVEFQAKAGDLYGRRLDLMITCVKDSAGMITEEPTDAPVSNSDDRVYTIKIEADCRGSGGGKGKGKWSFGDVMCLLIPLFFVIYLVGGILYLKFVKQEEGFLNVIPNRSFWGSLPGLVLDGVRFIRAKLCSGTGSGTSAGSDYDRL